MLLGRQTMSSMVHASRRGPVNTASVILRESMVYVLLCSSKTRTASYLSPETLQAATPSMIVIGHAVRKWPLMLCSSLPIPSDKIVREPSSFISRNELGASDPRETAGYGQEAP